MNTQNTVSKPANKAVKKTSVKPMKKKTNKLPESSPLPAPLAQVVVSSAKAINKIAMLFSLTVRCFIGNPQDKTLTAEVTTSHGVGGQKRLSVRKRIMQGDELNAVISAAQKLRLTHAAVSRPWFDGGTRAIPASAFIQIKQDMNALVSSYMSAVEKFINNYDLILARDKQELNGTFDIADYPSREELEGKFAVSIEFMPIPTAKDFRVDGLSDETLAQLQSDMEKGIAERMKSGDAELLQRLKDEVAHLLQRLTVKNKNGQFGFKQNSLDNIKSVAAEVAALNIGENAKISSLCDSLSTAFDLDGDLLRENDDERETKAKEAKAKLAEIEKAMQGLV
jgi:hypothetical protein